ncbi:MAG: toast rack family protein [Chloroflexota bacterium]
MNHKIVAVILILALASMACGFTVDIPRRPTPGPEVTDEITVAAPGSDGTRLTIEFGAGELNLSAGEGDDLVTGTATYNISDLKPEISEEDGDVLIQQGDYEFDGLPPFEGIKNVWNLKLGNIPMDLTIKAGAYDATYELGGLSLTGLTVKDGAADVSLSFTSPNQTEMSVLRYETGASNVKLTGLANANFNTLIFQSGAGDYTLDFSGELQRDATVTISSGLSNVILVVPENVNATITMESGITNVNTVGGWSQDGDIYTQKGDGPTLTFLIKMGAGNLTVTD